MSEDTNNRPVRSQFAGISIRGWLAILITVTVCAMSGFSVTVDEPLKSMAFIALGFYFGQKSTTK